MSETDLEKVPEAGALAEFDYGEDEGAGYEYQTKADSVIPWITILQPGSPQVVAETHRAGDFYNTVTQQVWSRDTGIIFIPATTRHHFSEWKPRKEGGGYVGSHAIDSDIVAKAVEAAVKFGRNKTEAGNDLTETFFTYGAIADEDMNAESMAAIAFKSTHIRPYKTWMTRLRQFTNPNTKGGRTKPPLYAHPTRITSLMKQNDEGTWYVPVIKSADPRGLVHSLIGPEHSCFQMAKACRMLLESGAAKVDESKMNAGEGDGDIPF